MTTANGTTTRNADHATITFSRRLAHPVDAVWAAITDSSLISQWLAPTTFDGREGGEVDIDFGGEEGHTTGRILTFDPPRTLEHEWHFPGEVDSVVRYDLTTDGDTTVLTLTHRRLSLAFAAGYGPGWHAYLDRLTAVLDGTDVPDWDERFDAVRPAYQT